MKPGRKPRETVDISLRKVTHDRLAVAAQRCGEKIGTLADSIIEAWLDTKERGVN